MKTVLSSNSRKGAVTVAALAALAAEIGFPDSGKPPDRAAVPTTAELDSLATPAVWDINDISIPLADRLRKLVN